MLKIHPDAIPMIIQRDGKDTTVGWRMETRDFTFDAIEHKSDDSVNVYIEWGDDQPGDMLSFDTWPEARNHLDSLLQSSRR